MSGVSRRSLFAGSLAAAGLAAVSRLPGARLVRAQGAAYEIVSFGPVGEGVLLEGDFLPQFGDVIGINGGGAGFGRIAASAEKFTPALFMADGKLTKLKSGKFGGSVVGVNADGAAAGFVYDTVGGVGEKSYNTYRQPAAWIDGDLVRLPVPDPEWDGTDRIGSATGISDDGTVLGNANGYSLRWVDGEAEVLPTKTGDEANITYNAIAPDGTLFGYSSQYDSNTKDTTYSYGVINGTTVEPFAGWEALQTGLPFLRRVNSASEALYSLSGGGLFFMAIAAPGQEMVFIDHREDGLDFYPAAFNADHAIVGQYQARAGLDYTAALYRDGAFTPIGDLLPAGHGFLGLYASGISDDGVISGGAWDEDGGFHPLLLVPA